jgi:ribose transport system substrate-binding protein
LKRKALVLATGMVICGLAVVAAGCGGDGGNKAAATEGGGGTDQCVSQAKSRAQEATAEKDFTLPGDSFDMSANAGKSVWIISASLSIPFNANEAKGSEDAAKAAGMKPKVFDGKGNVTSWNAGVNQAVGQGADAIILQGVDPKLVDSGLQKAKKKGIVVVDAFNSAPEDPLHDGVVAHVTADYHKAGHDLADWVLADSSCKASTLIFGAPTFAIELDMVEGFKKEYNSLCPSCKVKVHDINDLSQLDTELFSTTQSQLRSDPSIKYIFGVFDATVTFIQPAVEAQSSASDVKIISHDGVAENLQYIRDGKQAADGALPPLQVVGWAGIDQVGRALAGESADGWTIPDRVVDSTNIPDATDAFAIFPSWTDYQDQFKQLWGVA